MMSDYLDPNNKELLKDFFEEAEMQINTLEQNILVIENDPDNKDAIDEIFRAAHTLKGGAGTVEMTEIAEFTHLVEDVLDNIREGNIRVSSELVDCLLTSIDIIKKMIRERMNGNVFSNDITKVIHFLNSFLSTDQQHRMSSQQERGGALGKDDTKKTSVLSEYELLELRSSAADEDHLLKIVVHFNEKAIMNTVGGIQVYAALKEKAKILKTVPDFDLLYEDNFFPQVEYFIATQESEEAIQYHCVIPEVTLKVEIFPLTEDKLKTAKMESVPKESPVQKKMESDVVANSKTVKNTKNEEADVEEETDDKTLDDLSKSMKSTIKISSVLRVDSRRIDELMNLVSQAVINKATFNQITLIFNNLLMEFQESWNQNSTLYKDLVKSLPGYIENLNNNGHDSKKLIKEITEKYGTIINQYSPVETNLKGAVSQFKNTIQNLGRITNELQESVMRIRMVPVAHIFSRFPRLVRDLSRSLNKNINLHTIGEETELDKSVIEDMLDPLIHCVRNSLDHGIEPPEEREAAGKPPKGNIYLRASNEGNVIVIEVEDDGRGIDVDLVRTKAINRGILHPDKKLSELEAFNLIFEPGFSTASTVTNISGRGVGLDVVKKKVEKLNGSVSVWAKKGMGTKFTIKMPLTLAIIQGLLVKVGNETYAIPITSVIDSHRIQPSEIKVIDNYEVFNLRENVLSIIRLNRLFQIPVDENKPYYYVVVVGSGDNMVGVIVDALIGEEDVVIKPLKDRYASSPGIAGATILGDGSVSLIIDVSQLLDLGLRIERNKKLERQARII